MLYDHLSDLLRERGLGDGADTAFTELDRWLRNGGTRPSPWRTNGGEA
ncbi:hypothetical protein FHX37_1055 [Haloactinospora alba]|uniref:Uncharacterized protein n=2 Tax=Haloactinospora alba TaxID=405555 RepID=A0A543NH66_9ACTN|nr:hypothetical protein FHX37_1055 [Haloactinospora alba]